MPTILFGGRPENFCSAQTMASSGLVMQMTKAFGRILLDALRRPGLHDACRLMPIRSSRLMPGLRGTPAVTMMTSAPSMSSL